MDTFTLRNGARVGGVDALTVGTELTRIYNKQGALTAKSVVDESRPNTAPLHPAFEWDDSVAGEQYREHQARQIIKSVQVVKESEQMAVPAFVHVRTPGETVGEYHTLQVVASQPSKFMRAFAEAKQRVDSAHHALNILHMAAQQNTTVGQALKSVRSIQAMLNALQETEDIH